MLAIFEFLRDIFFFSGYLSNHSQAFPQPLSPQKEAEYIARYMEGDMQARDKLIEHNLRLVAHIAKKYTKAGADGDDFISIGTIGLIKGINTFHTEKGKLVTYISKCIENEILMFLRAGKKNALEVSLGESVREDKEGNKISLLDILGADQALVEDQVALKLQIERLHAILDKVLTRRERVVIDLRYGLSGQAILPQREIAEKLGISRSYISRIEKKALAKLNRELNRGG